jgi:hypothetical protein
MKEKTKLLVKLEDVNYFKRAQNRTMIILRHDA